MDVLWRDIKGYEGLYQISNIGEVSRLKKSGNRKKPMKPENKNGYLRVVLCKNGMTKHMFIHRLVAEAFIPNIENKPFVDHIDANPSNNIVSNLRWVTSKENSNNPITIFNLRKANSGKNNPMYGKRGENSPRHNTKHTNETRKKLSRAVVGFPKNKNAKVLEYYGTAEAERVGGFTDSNVASCCRGLYKYSKGYDWYYLDVIFDIYFKEDI